MKRTVWISLLTTANKLFTGKAEVGALSSNDMLHKAI